MMKLSSFFFNSCRNSAALLIVSSFFLVASAHSETRYVSDFLIVNIKDNLEKPYTVVTTVKTDDKVDVIDQTGRYLKIRTEDGKEGWISQQYLKTNLPKKIIIAQQKAEIASLQKRLEGFDSLSDTDLSTIEIQKKVVTLQTELADLIKSNKALQRDYDALKNQGSSVTPSEETGLGVSQPEFSRLQEENQNLKAQIEEIENRDGDNNPVDAELQTLKVQYTNLLNSTENLTSITEERDSLLEKNKQYKTALKSLELENSELRSNKLIYWFVAGALVFVFGLIFGKLGGRRRNKYTY